MEWNCPATMFVRGGVNRVSSLKKPLDEGVPEAARRVHDADAVPVPVDERRRHEEESKERKKKKNGQL